MISTDYTYLPGWGGTDHCRNIEVCLHSEPSACQEPPQRLRWQKQQTVQMKIHVTVQLKKSVAVKQQIFKRCKKTKKKSLYEDLHHGDRYSKYPNPSRLKTLQKCNTNST